MPSILVPSTVVNPGEGPRPVGGGGGGGSNAAITAHITDPAGAHAASAIDYGGGPNWADASTNPAATVEAQLDKIITDLADISGPSSGAGRIGLHNITDVTHGITYSATTLSGRLLELSNASFIAYDTGPTWADATTNPNTDVESQIDKIITDLSAGTAPLKIGTAAFNDVTHGINYVGTTLDARLTLLRNANYHGYAGGSQWYDGVSYPDTNVQSILDSIVEDLALSSSPSNSGADKVGIRARSSWLGGRTNGGLSSVYGAIDKIITDLAAVAVNDDGAERIGASAAGSLVSGSVRSQLNAIDVGWGKLDRLNSWTNTQVVQGISGDDLGAVFSTIGLPTERKVLWSMQTHTAGNWAQRFYNCAVNSPNGFEITQNALFGGATWSSEDTGDDSLKFSFYDTGTIGISKRDAGAGTWTDADASWDILTKLSTNQLILGDTGTIIASTINSLIDAENGRLTFSHVADVSGSDSNPPPTQGVINTLYAKNIPKAWGHITGGAVPALEGGFNTNTSITVSGNDLIVDLVSNMADTDYAVLLTIGPSASNDRIATVVAMTTGTFTLHVEDMSSGPVDMGASSTKVFFVVFGKQD